MKAEGIIRKAIPEDKYFFIEMVLKFTCYNREHHRKECRYDDFIQVLDAIKSKAIKTFTNRDDDVLILIAELNSKPAGYALARIYREETTADNGTGRMGLFDELYVDETARGLKLGQQLTDSVMIWMKSKGILRVKLHAYTWNITARKLYERNGFAEYALSYEKFI